MVLARSGSSHLKPLTQSLLGQFRAGGFLPGAANFFCQPVYAFPLAYGPMPPQHRQDGRRGRSGGGGEPPPHAQEQQQQQHSSLQSMDALKARILEAAPGEVKGIITASTVVPR